MTDEERAEIQKLVSRLDDQELDSALQSALNHDHGAAEARLARASTRGIGKILRPWEDQAIWAEVMKKSRQSRQRRRRRD